MPQNPNAETVTSLRVVDERQRLLKDRTTVTLQSVEGTGGPYKASSKAGVPAEYSLQIPRGTYDLTVAARKHVPHRSRVAVGDERMPAITITLYRKGEPEEGNAAERAHAWLADVRAYPAKHIPPNARRDAIEKKRRPPAPRPQHRSRARWTVLGPRNLSGRVRTLAAHPIDGETIFAGSANAGVWVTNDGARTWRALWFDEDVLEIGALAIHLTDPAQPNGHVTLYAGTGTVEFADPTIFPAYPGIGLMKSSNSGELGSWVNVSVPLTDITCIVVDPNSVSRDPTKIGLYVGGSGGLYESKDGGASWTQVMANNIRSLALDPSDTQSLYAGVATEGIQQINRTTLVASNFNSNVTGPYPTSMLVAIGQTSPFTIYAKYDDEVFRYNRSTKQWKNLGAHGGDTYGFWNECLAVDPNNSSIVLSGGTSLERTSDSGDTWTDVALDSDHHAVAFSSSDSLIAYVGNDHGVRKGSYSDAKTGSWAKTHNGLILMHYNGLGSSGIGPNVIGGGAQDNGTHRTVGGLTWDLLKGGDGGAFLYDPGDPYSMFFAESYSLGSPDNGDVFRTIDGGANIEEMDTSGFQGPFVTPLVLDPKSPTAARILFAGGVKKVFRSSDSASTWSASSPDMKEEVRALSVSPRSSAVMYAGTKLGGIWRSTDGGATVGKWKQITPGSGAPVPARRLTSVLADPLNTYGVYVTFGGLNSLTPNEPGHLFYGLSRDNGDTYTWDDRSGDLPDIPCYSVVIDPGDPRRMWIGTDIGVFESDDGGATWFGDEGLPNVVVTELRIRESEDVLRASTYGWGMWQRRIRPPVTPVDIYVRNNKMDTGEISPCPYNVVDPQIVGNKLYFWESPDVKVSWAAAPVDGVEFDQLEEAPLLPGVNPLYVQVHNRGWAPAANVVVKALWASGGAGLPPLPSDFWSTFPGNWSAASDWQPIDANLPFQTVAMLMPHTPAILTWSWSLPLFGMTDDMCVLVVISTDKDPLTRSDATPDDLIVDTVSPLDKHVAHRNLHPILVFGSSSNVMRERGDRVIELHNPYDAPDVFQVEVDRGTLPRQAKVDVLLPKDASTDPDPRRVLIPARSHVTARVSIVLPNSVKPGQEFRFSVIQRGKNRITGGSTYAVRVPPTVIRVGEKSSTRRRD